MFNAVSCGSEVVSGGTIKLDIFFRGADALNAVVYLSEGDLFRAGISLIKGGSCVELLTQLLENDVAREIIRSQLQAHCEGIEVFPGFRILNDVGACVTLGLIDAFYPKKSPSG
jgi:hypothetical protein